MNTEMAGRLRDFRSRVETELRDDILPFWNKHAPDARLGGFHGRISNDLTIDPSAEKGIILNSRILWTFSRAFRLYQDASSLQVADRAYDYIDAHFLDREYGGGFWTVDHRGRALDSKKRTYGQAFTLYAMSEYYRATGSAGALKTALELFALIEDRTKDRIHGGYFETYDRDWTLAADQRLSPVDQDDKKSMNTHLHLLEAYANLALATGQGVARDVVTGALKDLIGLFLDHILDQETSHFRLFFDEEWSPKSTRVSFGHDIEGSWLLCEAAEALGDDRLIEVVKRLALRMAEAVYSQAIDYDGGLLYEADRSGIVDYEKHWWPQAEAVVGFLNAYDLAGSSEFLTAALRCWEFIESKLIDREYGEWFWKVSREGKPDNSQPKVSQWKCPYHNGRMCFEVLERLKSI